MKGAGGGIMLEGQGGHAPRLYGRVSRLVSSQHRHFVVDVVVALGLMAIVLGQSWARLGPVTKWRVHNAAQLLERDLRFTQQTAVSAIGNRAHAELCMRARAATHECAADGTRPAFVHPRALPSSTTPDTASQ